MDCFFIVEECIKGNNININKTKVIKIMFTTHTRTQRERERDERQQYCVCKRRLKERKSEYTQNVYKAVIIHKKI